MHCYGRMLDPFSCVSEYTELTLCKSSKQSNHGVILSWKSSRTAWFRMVLSHEEAGTSGRLAFDPCPSSLKRPAPYHQIYL